MNRDSNLFLLEEIDFLVFYIHYYSDILAPKTIYLTFK